MVYIIVFILVITFFKKFQALECLAHPTKTGREDMAHQTRETKPRSISVSLVLKK